MSCDSDSALGGKLESALCQPDPDRGVIVLNWNVEQNALDFRGAASGDLLEVTDLRPRYELPAAIRVNQSIRWV